MPSDAAKKKAAKKKEAAKARQRPKKTPDENGDAGAEQDDARSEEANGTAEPGEWPAAQSSVGGRPLGSSRSLCVALAARHARCGRAGNPTAGRGRTGAPSMGFL